MILVWIVGFVLLCFAFVLVVGPPYLPTLQPQVTKALDMLDLQPGDTLLELGCGDGKVLIAAAERGWRAVGIELNPLLVAVCWWRTRRHRHLVTVHWGNYWDVRLWPAETDGIFGFVLPRLMTKLDETIHAWKKASGAISVQLASFAFKVPGKRIVREDSGVFLYKY